MYRHTTICLVFILLVSGCKKSDNAGFEYRNRTGRPLQMYWYRNKADIGFTDRALYHLSVPKDADVPMSYDWSEKFTPYYLDWYSDDYELGSWGNWNHEAVSRGWGYEVLSGVGYHNMGRKVALNGNDSVGRWKAVKTANGQPIPAGEHYNLEMTRNGYYRFDENGTIWKDSISSRDEEDDNFEGAIVNISLHRYRYSNSIYAARIQQGKPYWSKESTPAYGSDTLLLVRDVGLDLLYMVRQ